jgi:enoyl-CoA hydratase/carnithine racemase
MVGPGEGTLGEHGRDFAPLGHRRQAAGELADDFSLWVRSLLMSSLGEPWSTQKAASHCLVNSVCESREALYAGVRDMAATIAAKSPLSICGTKEMIT